MDFNNVV